MNSIPLRLGAAGLLLFGAWVTARAFDATPATGSALPPPPGVSALNPQLTVQLVGKSGAEAIPLEIDGDWILRDPKAGPDAPPLMEDCDFRGYLQLDPSGISLLPHLSCRDEVLLEARGDDALRIGFDTYPGRLRVKLQRTDDALKRPEKLLLFLDLPLEEYVVGVVSGEMSAHAPGGQEALMAQAITARTYALWKMSIGVDFLRDDTHHQVYRGTDYATEAARKAVQATRGMVLTWDDELLPAFFHARCGGATASATVLEPRRGDLPPLVGVEDPQCRDPYDRWVRDYPPEKMDELAQSRDLGKYLHGIHVLKRGRAQRAFEVRIGGADSHVDIPAEKLRVFLGMPSNQWTALLANPDGGLHVEGIGYGHGVGLCQTGALRLARSGQDYASILGHYFPGAVLSPLATVPGS